jgi:hypothetical protein
MKKSMILLFALVALAVHAYEEDDYFHPEDSWEIGTPDNKVKTVVIVDPSGNCGCK